MNTPVSSISADDCCGFRNCNEPRLQAEVQSGFLSTRGACLYYRGQACFPPGPLSDSFHPSIVEQGAAATCMQVNTLLTNQNHTWTTPQEMGHAFRQNWSTPNSGTQPAPKARPSIFFFPSVSFIQKNTRRTQHTHFHIRVSKHGLNLLFLFGNLLPCFWRGKKKWQRVVKAECLKQNDWDHKFQVMAQKDMKS